MSQTGALDRSVGRATSCSATWSMTDGVKGHRSDIDACADFMYNVPASTSSILPVKARVCLLLFYSHPGSWRPCDHL
jgi:hypothetical protein